MTHTYHPKGVCSRLISFELTEDGRLHNVCFQGGCHGNTQGLSKLAEGMPAEELVDRLSGIRCGMRPSSCPDQLAKAVRAALDNA